MTVKVSLAIITLNCADTIEKCLMSAKDYVDEVCILDNGSWDDTLERVRYRCPDAKIETWLDPERHPDHGWTSDFSALRNRNLDMCSHEVILWLDADDTLIDPKRLRAAINDAFSGKASGGTPADALSVRYEYSFDPAGHCTVALPRHRAFRKGYFTWEGVVHEDLRPLRPSRVLEFSQDETCFVRHGRLDAASPESARRNLWILEKYQAKGGKMNDRLYQNVATSLSLLGRYEEAIVNFKLALAADHDNTECDYISHLRCGEAHLMLSDPLAAMDCFARAQILFPDRKTPYLALAEVLVGRGRAEEALAYVEIAEHVNGDKSGFAWNPTTDNFVPRMVRAKALMKLEDYPGALAQYELLAKDFPKEDQITAPRDLLRTMLGNHRLYSSFMDVFEAIKASPANQEALLSFAPLPLRTFPEIAKRLLPKLPKDKRSVAIYCGASNAPWGADSVDTGVGGSEEAVVFLSHELADLGWHVEVYAYPGPQQMGVDDHGVFWAPYYAWDRQRPVDIYVGWRQFRDAPQTVAATKVLWLHDVVVAEYFTEEMVGRWSAILALSEYHARNLPEYAREKLVLTANGLSSNYFVNGPNLPHNFIYASSPDRGLEALLKQWPTIKAALPDATLDVYYGFTQHYLAEMVRNPELRRLRDSVNHLLTQPGVFMHGMVGQRELAYAFARCGFWLYPTNWSETSCITSMKAQAMGAIPITSRYPDSAIPETTKFDLGPPARSGSIYDDADWLAEWTATVIREVGRDHADLRKAMKTWARQEFSWSKVAAQWSALFSEKLASRQLSPKELVLSSTS